MRKFLMCLVAFAACMTSVQAFADPVEWCNFQYLGEKDHVGFGRILLPKDVSASAVNAYMACTDDINKPVSTWTKFEAVPNKKCDNCGANTEFMTKVHFAGYSKTTYCTFVFKVNPGEEIACRPVSDGEAKPIPLAKDATMSALDTRMFKPEPCDGSKKARCDGQELQVCVDGAWQHFEYCAEGVKCHVASASCKE